MFSEINTSVFPLQESFDSWRKYLSREFHLDATQTRVIGKGFFRAKCQLFKLGGLLLEHMVVTPHVFSYTGSTHSETISRNHLLVMLPIRGTAMRSFGEQSVHLAPGNVYIIDRSRPGTVRFTRRFESISVYVPREKFESLFPSAGEFFGIECSKELAAVVMLTKIMRAMHARALKLKEEPSAADNIDAAFLEALTTLRHVVPQFRNTQTDQPQVALSLVASAVAAATVIAADYSDAIQWLLPIAMTA